MTRHDGELAHFSSPAGFFFSFFPRPRIIYLLPNDTILDFPKLKAFADKRFDIAQIAEICLCREKNTGYRQFFFFSIMFSKDVCLTMVNTLGCVFKALSQFVRHLILLNQRQ